MILHLVMHPHIRAILANMSPGEREFFGREPQRSWLMQMAERLSTMAVPDGALMVRENMAAFRPRSSDVAKKAADADAKRDVDDKPKP